MSLYEVDNLAASLHLTGDFAASACQQAGVEYIVPVNVDGKCIGKIVLIRTVSQTKVVVENVEKFNDDIYFSPLAKQVKRNPYEENVSSDINQNEQITIKREHNSDNAKNALKYNQRVNKLETGMHDNSSVIDETTTTERENLSITSVLVEVENLEGIENNPNVDFTFSVVFSSFFACAIDFFRQRSVLYFRQCQRRKETECLQVSI